MSSLTSQAVLAKAVSVHEAALFVSTLGDHINLAEPGMTAATVWAERVRGPDFVGSEVVMVGTTGERDPASGAPVALRIVGLDPRPGLRVGLWAPVTVPAGSLETPKYRILGVRADPAYSPAVTRYLEQQQLDGELHDFGAIEVMLRSAAEELSFVWWATAVIALLVSIVIFLTTSSVARMVRTYDLAMLRVIGISGRDLAAGPLHRVRCTRGCGGHCRRPGRMLGHLLGAATVLRGRSARVLGCSGSGDSGGGGHLCRPLRGDLPQEPGTVAARCAPLGVGRGDSPVGVTYGLVKGI